MGMKRAESRAGRYSLGCRSLVKYRRRISPDADYQKKRLRSAVAHARELLQSSAHDKLLRVLSEERLDELVHREGGPHRRRVYPPLTTLSLFVEQVLSVDSACQDTVGRHLSQRSVLGLAPSSLNTGPYCKARQRLPLTLVEACVEAVAQVAAAALSPQARWRGREIKLVDGTTVSMPDTPALQAQFPQHNVQPPGLGFPLARIVGVISLGSGCVSDWTVAACQGQGVAEPLQLWRLLDRFAPGDMVIADRAYSSYFLLAALKQRGIDFVIREHQLRKNDPANCVALGPDDQLIRWERPQRPSWMDEATYTAMPATLTLREVRDGQRLLVTTLSDPGAVDAQEIGWLYNQRWHIELDFRAIKCVMQMDVLRCKTPDMVRKEIAAYLLGYNLIRAVMGEAAKPQGLAVRRLSFAAARRAAVVFQETLRHRPTLHHRAIARYLMLQFIAYWRIPERPDRVEPRAIKRRPKSQALLTVPRAMARHQLRAEQQAA